MIRKTLFLSALSCLMAFASTAQQFKALLFTKTVGWHHESIHEGVTAMRWLADRHDFSLYWTENERMVFNEKALAKYDVVIFLNTTGDVLNDEQQAAFEKFIQSGKGYVGIHSASDTEYEWSWYTQLVGRMFKIHPANQTALIKVEDRNFPGMQLMPDVRWWTDEWYEFGEEKVEGLKYLVSVDESTYNAKVEWKDNKSEGMPDFHPISWYHEFDGGRAFYTALGHLPKTYSDPLFLEHIYGGVFYAATGKGIMAVEEPAGKKKNVKR
ncbi:ThuA domain-containing protein [Reichenbachiella agarivorans]|uniref:ThuA domain-containing protein n=1 Tax=Reichenbachiella agarivorans TaxID=2979464 RepID=A0ABY6CP74_9BACT|nr:ThuA domain-containing protein [Reichenbachiella agarivorans]UXP32315.1 ThuA domain-containing protein [Reichenbachiella agarivorans]